MYVPESESVYVCVCERERERDLYIKCETSSFKNPT